jgi:peroxiredoxin
MKQISRKGTEPALLALKAVIGILAFSMLLSSCGKDDKDDLKPIETEAAAPDFSLKSLNGNEVGLAQFDNKVVVLFFFGNNCPSCKAAAPSVQSMLVDPFASSTDYMVLGLDQWNGNAAAVQAFQTATNVTFPLLLNASGVAADYKTTFDRIVVIDKSGKIVFSGTQSAASDIAGAKAKVLELLAPATAAPVPNLPSTVGNAPGFTLKSSDGNDVSLSQFANKVVVLFFFGNNCSSCKAVAPHVESMLVAPFASNTDYMLLGLDQWNGNAASVQAFKASTSVTFPLLLNASKVASDYKTTYDRIVVIGKSGNIEFNGSQLASSDIAAAKDKITELLAE